MLAKTVGSDEPEVIRVLWEFRAQLDASEVQVMRKMSQAWIEVERGLKKDMELLAEEMFRRKAEGREITEQMIWRSERYKVLQKQMKESIAKYNGEALEVITKAQKDAAGFGINSANAAVLASLGPTTRTWDRLNVNAVNSIVGFAQDGTPLHRLLARDYPLAVDGLLKGLINGIARGQGPVQTAKDMADGMGMGLERATLIARTEMARAYRTGSVEQYRKSGVVLGYKRLVKKETACMACLMLDGQEFILAHELTDHPRGKCTPVPIVEGTDPPKWETGPEWFENQTPEIQIAKLGQARYDLWKSGKIELQDLVTYHHSPIWGSSPKVPTLAQLRGLTEVDMDARVANTNAAGQVRLGEDNLIMWDADQRRKLKYFGEIAPFEMPERWATTEEAGKWIKNNFEGRVTLGSIKELASITDNETMTKSLHHFVGEIHQMSLKGYKIPRTRILSSSNHSSSEDAVAYYLWGKKEVHMNFFRESTYNLAKRQSIVDSGWLSSLNTYHHETAHWYVFDNKNREFKINKKSPLQTSWTTKPKGKVELQGLPHYDARPATLEVSRYASHNYNEFVAEVFAGHSSSKVYSDNVYKLYMECGGPALK